MQTENEILTLDEMAQRLKVRKSWLYSRTRQRSKGSIPFIRIGKYIRFSEPEVISWIKAKYCEVDK